MKDSMYPLRIYEHGFEVGIICSLIAEYMDSVEEKWKPVVLLTLYLLFLFILCLVLLTPRICLCFKYALSSFRTNQGVGKMAQWVKALATKARDMSSIPEIW